MTMNEDRLSGSFLYSIVLKALELTEKSKTQTALKGDVFIQQEAQLSVKTHPAESRKQLRANK